MLIKKRIKASEPLLTTNYFKLNSNSKNIILSVCLLSKSDFLTYLEHCPKEFIICTSKDIDYIEVLNYNYKLNNISYFSYEKNINKILDISKIFKVYIVLQKTISGKL